ncbi:TPA: phage antirepressor KilAC domain-containing protein [Streptococcus suis]|nr:phage antirepressor KilAC domain-containing protein [Streptococcus suis]HEM5121724.1 phage antirepressor KilAC domain-containing protein [Streptococcus suis]HEM5156777.1 phage antirepressor KilAC domain-containing protein [Streptococcus suis]HEM5192235.1 phage antirepressor KilAC domain-containing protein [Streptococcus suis]
MELHIIKQQEVLGKNFTIYGTADEPLFLAKDVAEWIEHSNPTEMLRKIDEDEKLTSTILRAGQAREVNLLTENGLYEVLMQSRKPIAKQFKKKVKEILKSIRKNGTYVTDQKAVEIATNPDALGAFLQNIADQVKRLEMKNEALEVELKETKPKAEYYDLMLANKGLIKTSEIAKNYGRSAQAFNKLLHKLKVIYKQGETWLPYAKYQTHNYVQLEPFSYTNSRGLPDVKMRTKWTMKGHIFLYELLKKNGILPLIEQ